MNTLLFDPISYSWFLPLMVVLALFDGVMKVIAMWKAARNNHLAWFIIIAVINSVGILPIIYIIMDKKGTFADTLIEPDAD